MSGSLLDVVEPRSATRQPRAIEVRAQHLLSRLGGITSRIVGRDETRADPLPRPERPQVTETKAERRFVPQPTAVVDEQRCTCCGLCVDVCPEQAIGMDAAVTVDPRRCTGCGSCVRECPNEALSLLDAPQRAMVDVGARHPR
jgi:ferredoxin